MKIKIINSYKKLLSISTHGRSNIVLLCNKKKNQKLKIKLK